MRKPSIASQAVIYTDKISILPPSLIRPDPLGSTALIPELTALVILHPVPSPSQPHRIPQADLGGGTFPDTPESEVTYPGYPGWVVKGGAGSPPGHGSWPLGFPVAQKLTFVPVILNPERHLHPLLPTLGLSRAICTWGAFAHSRVLIMHRPMEAGEYLVLAVGSLKNIRKKRKTYRMFQPGLTPTSRNHWAMALMASHLSSAATV